MVAAKKTTTRRAPAKRAPAGRAPVRRAPARTRTVTETVRVEESDTPLAENPPEVPDRSEPFAAEVEAEGEEWVYVDVEGLSFRCLPLTDWPGRVYDAIVDQGSLSAFPSLTHPDDQEWFREEWADLQVGARSRVLDAAMEALGQSVGGSRASRRASARGRRK